MGTLYNPCGTSCPQTCGTEMETEESCTLSCTEACQCEGGQVLSDGVCISKEECGCLLPNGGYVKVHAGSLP